MPNLSELPLLQIPVVEPRAALNEVIYLMRHEPLKAVAIVGDSQFFGIYDEYAHESGLVPPDIDRSTLQVGPYIHPTRAVGYPEMQVDEAAAIMKRKHLKVLPIVRNRTYLGVVTDEDVNGAA